MTPHSVAPLAPPVDSSDAAREPTAQLGPPDDGPLIEALRRGDEAAFCTVIERHHGTMLRLARLYVRDAGAAEDVAQETWLGVLRGLDRFEGRASLKTWICRILVNRAKTRAERDGRFVPFSDLASAETDEEEPAVDPGRFRANGHWVSRPTDWGDLPEERLLADETTAVVRRAIESLPPTQREVITFRDVDGWTSDEVCNILEISETNQRVLLHRARSKVRRALDQYLERS
jgi:RNA polymerase sigma-70 factor (ECF subfamily)